MSVNVRYGFGFYSDFSPLLRVSIYEEMKVVGRKKEK
jgi:hypothetical protein